ncbi:MAG: shikimate dehydrogenase [Bacteroidia bacterium]|nr:shikimate dehydrogenase [Bacteroidia bacterium]
MKVYGLIGYPLEHSFSKSYFETKFKELMISGFRYENFPMQSIENLKGLLLNNYDIAGLNVTIPLKEKAFSVLDYTDDIVNQVHAVNTIKVERKENSTFLKGYNTDVTGFEKSLIPLLRKQHRQALILGTGGGSKAVAFVLNKLDIPFHFVSRNAGNPNSYLWKDIDREIIENHLLIINTTPLGMFPHSGSFPPLPYSYIGKDHLLFDLVYNPPETEFMKKGKEMGAVICNGLEMLHLQADHAWKIWNDDAY